MVLSGRVDPWPSPSASRCHVASVHVVDAVELGDALGVALDVSLAGALDVAEPESCAASVTLGVADSDAPVGAPTLAVPDTDATVGSTLPVAVTVVDAPPSNAVPVAVTLPA